MCRGTLALKKTLLPPQRLSFSIGEPSLYRAERRLQWLKPMLFFEIRDSAVF